MSGRRPWSELVAETFPEVINARFPRGTKRRLDALVAREMDRLARGDDADAIRLSPSVMVRRAVLEYLDREEER